MVEHNYVDLLGKDLAYVVLSKRKGRDIRLLVRPTKQELRERGKRNWKLVDVVENPPEQQKQCLKAVLAILGRHIESVLDSDDQPKKEENSATINGELHGEKPKKKVKQES